jgi:hypothetical protein
MKQHNLEIVIYSWTSSLLPQGTSVCASPGLQSGEKQLRLLYPPSATTLSATIAIAVHYRSTVIYKKHIAEALAA